MPRTPTAEDQAEVSRLHEEARSLGAEIDRERAYIADLERSMTKRGFVICGIILFVGGFFLTERFGTDAGSLIAILASVCCALVMYIVYIKESAKNAVIIRNLQQKKKEVWDRIDVVHE